MPTNFVYKKAESHTLKICGSYEFISSYDCHFVWPSTFMIVSKPVPPFSIIYSNEQFILLMANLDFDITSACTEYVKCLRGVQVEMIDCVYYYSCLLQIMYYVTGYLF